MSRDFNALVNIPSDETEELRNPASVEGLTRRQWLKHVMMGSIGVGLSGFSLPTFAEETALSRCHHILRVSKDLSAEIRKYACTSCECKKVTVVTVYTVSFDFKGLLQGNTYCDETVKLMPENSTMVGSIKMILRRGACPQTDKPQLWGCHDGRFEIYGSNTDKIFSGTLSGTFGVDHRAVKLDRCCWPNGEGVLRGKGFDKYRDCEICATYQLNVPLNMGNPCTKTPTKALKMQFDGTVKCPC